MTFLGCTGGCTCKPCLKGFRFNFSAPIKAQLVAACKQLAAHYVCSMCGAGDTTPCVSTCFRLVRLAPEAEAALAAANIKVIYCMAQAPIKTLGIIIKTEGGTWMVGVGGYQGHHPPFQDDKILQWAEKVGWHLYSMRPV